MDLKTLIRSVPDFPKKGILYYDITTLLKDKRALEVGIDTMAERYRGGRLDIVSGVESRGFILAPALAYQLGAGFVPIRKTGKLPAATLKAQYDLEYGQDIL